MYTIHEGHKDYTCDSCGLSFNQGGDLKKHIHRIHVGHKDFNTKKFHKNHESHLKVEIGKDQHSKSYNCAICGNSFLTKKSFTNHYSSAHKHWQKEVKEFSTNNDITTSLYQCEICEKSFDERKKLTRHKDWHREWTHECEVCNKKLPTRSILRTHKIKNHVPKSCRWNCGETFSSHGGRIKHERTKHYQNKPMERNCDICGKPCPTEVQLKNHKRTHMNPLERTDKYKCPTCSEIFSSRRKIEGHNRLLHAKFICSKCGKRFIKEHCFKTHTKKCELMDNSIVGEKTVRKVSKVHSCDQCSSDQKYDSKGFRKHLKNKHSTIFKCDECKKTFPTEYYYKRHIKKHKNSKCHLCNLSVTLHNGPQKIQIHLLTGSDGSIN